MQMNEPKKYKTVTLKIKGDRIPADKLRKSIGVFYGFIDEVASEVSGQKKPIRWIVRVKKGSIVLANEAEVDGRISLGVRNRIFESIEQGIDSLEKEATRPAHFSDRALEFLQDLASISKGKGNGLGPISITVEKKPHKLTPHTVANVDSILGVYSKALGSVEGRLQTLSERSGLKFYVYDSLSDKPIRCDVDEDLRDEATNAFGKRVYVYGLMSYDKNGIAKSIRVQEIKIFKGADELPSAFEICGILEA